MINALAGLIFGLLAHDWATRIILPLLWGFVACAYHAAFSVRERQLFIEENRRQGRRSRQARLTYYARRYRRALLISMMFSFIGGLVASLD